jgi:hypothetical protein
VVAAGEGWRTGERDRRLGRDYSGTFTMGQYMHACAEDLGVARDALPAIYRAEES